MRPGTTKHTMCGNTGGYRLAPAVLFIFAAPVLSMAALAGTERQDEIYLAGRPGAPVKIEVFSDYQCPVCRSYYLDTLKPLIAEFTKTNKINKISIVYHDFPLETIHQFARKAVRFGLAAPRLGPEKWLKVTDALYAQQAVWSENGNIEAVLGKVLDPADLNQLKKAVADPAIDARINQEIALGQSRAVTSTPTTFIITETGRQQRFTGDPSYPALRDYLDKLVN